MLRRITDGFKMMMFLRYVFTLSRMQLMRPHKRAAFALAILDKVHQGKPAGAYCDSMELIRDIEKTKLAGMRAALSFVEARAGSPPYVGPCDFNNKQRPGLELRVLLWSLKFYLVSEMDQDIEQSLLSIIRKSLPHADEANDAGSLIGVAATHLHRRFQGYPKPDNELGLPSNIQVFLR